jgi:hypothetical protein
MKTDDIGSTSRKEPYWVARGEVNNGRANFGRRVLCIIRRMPTRRDVIKAGAAPFLMPVTDLTQTASRGPRVVVVGAGAFGGWTAL